MILRDLLLTSLLSHFSTLRPNICSLLSPLSLPQSNCSLALTSRAVCIPVFNILYIVHIDPSGTQSVLSKLKERFVSLVRK